jgi:tRNA A-37 threonylcarbamoyl transferase component Bud32
MSLATPPEIITRDDPFERRSIGAARWIVRAGWIERLLDAEGLRLDEWLADGSAQVVKHGAHRVVYRVERPEGSFYLKHYRCSSIVDLARNWLRPPAAHREFSKALELAQRGLPTFYPLALGETREWGSIAETFLITEAIPDTVSLLDYATSEIHKLDSSQQPLVRAQLADALALLCVQLHRAGVFHNDLHAGNILVQRESCEPDEQGRIAPRFFLVDLPGITFSAPLDWPRSRDSLLMLHSDWSQRATMAERWRFWRRYSLERAELRLPNLRAAGLEVFAHTRDYSCRVLAGRVKRALRSNRDYHSYSGEQARGHAITQLAANDLAQLVNDPERLFRDFWHEPVKLTPASMMVTAEMTLDGQPTAVAYKRIRPRNVLKRVGSLAGRHRALNAWLLGHALLERGIATARPVAVVVPKGLAQLGAGYVATEWIADAQNLHLYLWRLARLPSAERLKQTRRTAVALGRLIGRMHAWRVAHRDLKGCNLLLSERGEAVEAYLIDLDGVRIRRRLGYAEQVRNLARLAVSVEAHAWIRASDRRRFVAAYQAELAPLGVDPKRLWRDVARHARRIVERLRKQGKPIA